MFTVSENQFTDGSTAAGIDIAKNPQLSAFVARGLMSGSHQMQVSPSAVTPERLHNGGYISLSLYLSTFPFFFIIAGPLYYFLG